MDCLIWSQAVVDPKVSGLPGNSYYRGPNHPGTIVFAFEEVYTTKLHSSCNKSSIPLPECGGTVPDMSRGRTDCARVCEVPAPLPADVAGSTALTKYSGLVE